MIIGESVSVKIFWYKHFFFAVTFQVWKSRGIKRKHFPFPNASHQTAVDSRVPSHIQCPFWEFDACARKT
jgi:hypothetical protein